MKLMRPAALACALIAVAGLIACAIRWPEPPDRGWLRPRLIACAIYVPPWGVGLARSRCRPGEEARCARLWRFFLAQAALLGAFWVSVAVGDLLLIPRSRVGGPGVSTLDVAAALSLPLMVAAAIGPVFLAEIHRSMTRGRLLIVMECAGLPLGLVWLGLWRGQGLSS